MNILRRFFVALLVLTMVATSGSMAAMRDHGAGAQELVICTGMGLQTILVDAHGEQVDPAPICPDCTMVVMADAPPPMEMVTCGDIQALPRTMSDASQAYEPRANEAIHARAPPVG